MLFDDVLRAIGELGPYQICLYILLCLVGLPTGWQNLGLTFFGGHMDHWCLVPELANLSYNTQKYVAAADEAGDYSQCRVYDLNYSQYDTEDFLTWNRSVMSPEGAATRKCGPDGWVYDKSQFVSSVVSQFDLVCDDANLVSIIQTVYMAGFLLGCIGFGQVSDRWGRYTALVISLVMEVVFATVATFIPNYAAYVTLRFFVGTAAAGSFTTIFVMSMEIIGPKYRMATGIMVQAWFAMGFMTIPWMSYAVRDHIKLQLICAICPITMWALFAMATESPRWLVSEGHDKKAIKVLKKISAINEKHLPEDLHLEDNRLKTVGDTKASLPDLFRKPNIRKITVNMWFCWFVTSMVYYGLSLGVDLLPGDIFMNSFISGLVEIPAYVITMLMLDKTGRKWPTCITLVLGGACCLACMPLIDNEELEIYFTVFLMLGKFFLSATFAIVYVYAAELFPTVMRQVGVGSSSMCARVGGLIQPQINLVAGFWSPGPFLIYGILSILAGIFAIFFPETMNRKLPETVEEGEEFAKNIGLCKKKTAKAELAMDGVTNAGFDLEDGDYATINVEEKPSITETDPVSAVAKNHSAKTNVEWATPYEGKGQGQNGKVNVPVTTRSRSRVGRQGTDPYLPSTDESTQL